MLISFNFSVGQDPNNKKTQFGIFSGIQLSSTKLNVCLTGKVYEKNNIFYLGIKTPLSTNSVYGNFPIGVLGGYGYSILKNETWKMATVLDAQWLGSKIENQDKITH